jgi:hypothetical protein
MKVPMLPRVRWKTGLNGAAHQDATGNTGKPRRVMAAMSRTQLSMTRPTMPTAPAALWRLFLADMDRQIVAKEALQQVS